MSLPVSLCIDCQHTPPSTAQLFCIVVGVSEPVWEFDVDQDRYRPALAGPPAGKPPIKWLLVFLPSADKLASKLSDSMMSVLDLSGNADDSAGDWSTNLTPLSPPSTSSSGMLEYRWNGVLLPEAPAY